MSICARQALASRSFGLQSAVPWVNARLGQAYRGRFAAVERVFSMLETQVAAAAVAATADPVAGLLALGNGAVEESGRHCSVVHGYSGIFKVYSKMSTNW